MKWETHSIDIAKELRNRRNDFFNLLSLISEESWYTRNFCGKWSINDVVLHIIGWDEFLLSQVELWIVGNTPDYTVLNEDKFNNEYILKHPTKTKEETIFKFKKSTENILNFLENLTENQINYAKKKESLIDLDLESHDIEHYTYIKENYSKVFGN